MLTLSKSYTEKTIKLRIIWCIGIVQPTICSMSTIEGIWNVGNPLNGIMGTSVMSSVGTMLSPTPTVPSVVLESLHKE